MLEKTQLPCCAMCFLSGTDNYTTERELNRFVDKLKYEAFSHPWKTNNRDSGERTILTITSPHEILLGKTLERVGFEKLSSELNRRFGYPEANLTLFMYKF